MKALIALLALLLLNPVAAKTSLSLDELGVLTARMENAARQFLKNSREAEVEFRYQQRQSLKRNRFMSNSRPHSGKLEQVYCYRIIYRKTPDGRLHYEIESRTEINGKFRKLRV